MALRVRAAKSGTRIVLDPLFLRRDQQAALKFSYRSDRVACGIKSTRRKERDADCAGRACESLQKMCEELRSAFRIRSWHSPSCEREQQHVVILVRNEGGQSQLDQDSNMW